MPLTRYYILENDTTTAGGIVQATTNPTIFNVSGKKQSCIGDDVWCPACQSMGQIVPSGPRLSFSLGGAMPALNDDLCLCKCTPPPKLVHSQTSFKEIIDDNRLAQYQKAREQYRQSKLQNNLTNSHSDDLPNFTVHFRRPDDYKGEYGFDWLRDEYIYPLVEVNGVKEKLSLLPNNVLINEYRQFKKQPIKELDNIDNPNYTPAWLTIFPSKDIGVDKVYLNLRIDLDEREMQTFSADGVSLSFECDMGLKIFPTNLLLSEFLDKAKQKSFEFAQPKPIDYSKPITNETLKQQDAKTIVFYESNNPIIILSCDKVLQELSYIKVFAKKGGIKKQVGLLCVYPNNEVKKALIQPVFIKKNISPVYDNGIVYPKNFKTLIQDSLLSQSLIKAEFKQNINLTISDIDFLIKYPDKNSPIKDVEEFLSDLIALYHKMTNDNPYYNKHITYLFFTDYSAEKPNGSQTKGLALGDTATEMEKLVCRTENICNHWKNATVIFSNIQTDDNAFTVIHELGHTFGLAHIFAKGKSVNFENITSFPQGYTDNIMDYTQTEYKDSATKDSINNIHIGKMFSLFKYQWDKIHNDSNLT